MPSCVAVVWPHLFGPNSHNCRHESPLGVLQEEGNNRLGGIMRCKLEKRAIARLPLLDTYGSGFSTSTVCQVGIFSHFQMGLMDPFTVNFNTFNTYT